jgi:two-component system cell cycle response regulator
MRVLVADDSDMYRKLLQTLLKEWGHEVALATNGNEARAILESSNVPPFAILNCFMPGLGGLELCELIRARKQDYIYTILLSAADQEIDVLKGFALGADDYICKPFKEPELKARIEVGERIIGLQEALKKENQELRVEASRDSLLRLWNRRAIYALLNTESSRAKRSKTSLSIFFIDLDYFKLVNDTHGHMVGDDVLISVAKKVSGAVREYDHVGRCGGEEFLVVLPNCTAEAALEVAERVRQHICDEPIVIASTQLRITVSIGLSQWHSDEELADLLRRADVALYRAKRNGRNRVEVEGAGKIKDALIENVLDVRPSLSLPITEGTSMRKRLDVRHRLALPVRIWGMDATGQMFEECATTVDITTTGANIAGIKHLLQRGCVIGVEHRSSRARYRVTWVKSADEGQPGKVGVQLIETGKFIWGRVIPRVFVDSMRD